MWTRAELKERAKAAFKRNYWVCVAAAFILSLLIGGNTTSSGGGSSSTDTDDILSDDYIYSEDVDEVVNIFDDLDDDEAGALAILGIAGVVVLVIVLIILVVAAVFSIFVGSVIEVGGCRFFTVNTTQDASLKELFHGFGGGNYMRNVSTQFFRTLYTFLWTLLFIIPGIVKAYEYQMIPYILADNPNISRQEAFALSKRMMDGHKWDAFVLDLSFIGWELVSAVTCGVAGLFWVDPYIRATYAELYLKLKSNVMPVQTIETNQYGWDEAQRI